MCGIGGLVECLFAMEEARRRLRGPRAGDGTYSSSVAFPSLSLSASWSRSTVEMECDEFCTGRCGGGGEEHVMSGGG